MKKVYALLLIILSIAFIGISIVLEKRIAIQSYQDVSVGDVLAFAYTCFPVWVFGALGAISILKGRVYSLLGYLSCWITSVVIGFLLKMIRGDMRSGAMVGTDIVLAAMPFITIMVCAVVFVIVWIILEVIHAKKSGAI